MSGVVARHSSFVTPDPASGWSTGQVDVALLQRASHSVKSPKRRGAEQRSLCGWHFSFALIYRGRRLSARNSGSASPVETFHPRWVYYTRFLHACSGGVLYSWALISEFIHEFYVKLF